MTFHKTLFAMTALIWTLTLFTPGMPAGSLPDKDQIKTAFLYNFAKFVEWPPESLPEEDTPYTFSFIARNPLPGWTTAIENRTIRGRGIIVRHIRTIEELEPCHVLFIHRSMGNESKMIVERMKKRPVLTVGDEIDLARQGGIINFIQVRNRIRFEVNVSAARRAGLNISSQLLKLAPIVKSGNKGN